MKIAKYLLMPLLMVIAVTSAMAQVEFGGNSKPVYDVTPETNTGLNHIFVLYDAQGVSMSLGPLYDPKRYK